MNNLSIGILYLGLHNQLVKKFGVNATISNKDFFMKIGRHSQIPKNLRHMVLKEMERKGLLQKINRDKIKILELKIDIKSDCKEFFKMMDIY